MIPILRLTDPADVRRVEALFTALHLHPSDIAVPEGERARETSAVQAILGGVAKRGDEAVVDVARRFDDPNFQPDQIRITVTEMRAAAARVPPEQQAAIRQSIAQVREYQQHIMPKAPPPLVREGTELGLRFTPLDSVGLCVPGGKASYPSSLIMLAVPAQVAGVKKIIACTPPSKFGRSDLVLATMLELGLIDCFRAGGAAAVAAMAFGTETIPAVDKIVGPGNIFVQLAKRLLAGSVGIDGFLGPSEIITIADETGRADFIAADLIAQAEHDPGSCYLLTTSAKLAEQVSKEIEKQFADRQRQDAIEESLKTVSAIIVHESIDTLIELANRFAAEHVNVQTKDDRAVVAKLKHAGAIFVGPYSPIAAGDYVAGPSHCLPTNTTARFSSGISVYEFLKRSSIVKYENAEALSKDSAAITSMAEAESLDGHAASIRVRGV